MRSLYLVFILTFAYATANDDQLSDIGEIFKNDSEMQKYFHSKLSKGHADFTLDVNRALVALTGENSLFSPISLTAVLAMSLLGSRGNTFHELAKVLHYDSDLAINKYSEIVHMGLGSLLQQRHNSSYDLRLANGIFLQEDFELRSEYLNAAKSYYGNEVVKVNFARQPMHSMDVVNEWVDRHTNGKIQELVKDLFSLDTRAVLASAMYFRADWEAPFIPENTVKRVFRVDHNETIEVEMMKQIGNYPSNYDDDLRVEILGIPYENKEATMYILLPFDEGVDAVKTLAKKLTAEKLSNLIDNSVLRKWTVHIPKMNLTKDVPIKAALQYLGLRSFFSENADLSVLAAGDVEAPAHGNFKESSDEIVSHEERKYKEFLDEAVKLVKTEGVDDLRNKPNLRNPGLQADEMRHRVQLEVNEKGSEGAGASSVGIVSRILSSDFVVNRPFMFFIQQNNPKVFLFAGTIYKV